MTSRKARTKVVEINSDVPITKVQVNARKHKNCKDNYSSYLGNWLTDSNPLDRAFSTLKRAPGATQSIVRNRIHKKKDRRLQTVESDTFLNPKRSISAPVNASEFQPSNTFASAVPVYDNGNHNINSPSRHPHSPNPSSINTPPTTTTTNYGYPPTKAQNYVPHEGKYYNYQQHYASSDSFAFVSGEYDVPPSHNAHPFMDSSNGVYNSHDASLRYPPHNNFNTTTYSHGEQPNQMYSTTTHWYSDPQSYSEERNYFNSPPPSSYYTDERRNPNVLVPQWLQSPPNNEQSLPNITTPTSRVPANSVESSGELYYYPCFNKP
mmetsp:Transcript_34869/g.59759  ORF Transcript_34869/g.59759 Transcript_34869/m.59759 type:complete len:321 (+) Transcript_34869:109-1071(+)